MIKNEIYVIATKTKFIKHANASNAKQRLKYLSLKTRMTVIEAENNK